VVSAVILAAGASTRMGFPKALLPDDRGHPFILRISHTMAESGLPHVTIVTGVHHDRIVSALERHRAPPLVPVVVRNPDPGRGQLSSLWTAMDQVCTSDTEALVVTLVDVPLLTAETVRAVVEAWRRSRAPIVRPIFEGRRGHPVIFDRAVFAELRAAPLEAGARVVVRAHVHDSLDVPVNDPGCLVDIDTPGEYSAHIERS
jgi:molybdenum cofactor cytidylyltransferase